MEVRGVWWNSRLKAQTVQRHWGAAQHGIADCLKSRTRVAVWELRGILRPED